MPYYNKSAFAPLPQVMTAALPSYFFGSLPTDTDDTYLRISSVSMNTDVATVVGTIYRGNIPAVGNLITIQGTATNSGVFNVTAVPLTAVSGDAATRVYSLSFALTNADVSATPDAGMAIIPIAEVPETLADGASIAWVPASWQGDMTRTHQAVVSFPTIPTACTVTLQAAARNIDSEYQDLGFGPAATVAGGVVTQSQAEFTLTAAGFLRFRVSGLSGSGTIVAKTFS